MYLLDLCKKYYPKLLMRLRYPLTQVGTNFQCAPGFKIVHGSQNVQIGNNCILVDGLLNAGDTKKITLGNAVFFGHGVKLLARSHNIHVTGETRQKEISEKNILIHDGVWLASGVTVLGGVTIGKNSVVGASSVVTKNVPPNTVVAGNPAKIIKTLDL